MSDIRVRRHLGRDGRALSRRVSIGLLGMAVTALVFFHPFRTTPTRGEQPLATPMSSAPASPLASPATGLPKIGHVFIIVDENESASTTFGPNSPATYLSKTLRAEGAYLPNYYGIGHESNDNYIAMVSGQAPNALNQSDCQLFSNFIPSTIGAYGQVDGVGCVYPASVLTIGNQLANAGLTWRDYNDSMGSQPTRESSECGHPAIGQPDHTQTETATDQYATRHDPFVYFHSIIDNTVYCDQHVVNLDPLTNDLSSTSLTPNYVFITPGLCDDGHDAKCANGGPGGLGQADTFLREWVPRITSSPAFTQQNGLLIITFDEAATTDASSCCGEIAGPGSPLPGILGSGGGDVGAVLISPCIQPGTVSERPYNHYAMLRSVEDLFHVSHLGYAQLPGETSFGSDIFTRPCSQTPTVHLSASRVRGGIELRWRTTTSVPASSYDVQARTGGGPWQTVDPTATGSALRFPALGGVRYQFRVRGTGWNGIGAFSAIARVGGRR
jgi:hypothetical protein